MSTPPSTGLGGSGGATFWSGCTLSGVTIWTSVTSILGCDWAAPVEKMSRLPAPPNSASKGRPGRIRPRISRRATALAAVSPPIASSLLRRACRLLRAARSWVGVGLFELVVIDSPPSGHKSSDHAFRLLPASSLSRQEAYSIV